MTVAQEVVVTGMGLQTPAGCTPEEVWGSLLRGRSTAQKVPAWEGVALLTVACEATQFDPEAYFSPRERRKLDRGTQLGIAAAKDAIARAGLFPADSDPRRVGVCVGSGAGGIAAAERLATQHHGRPHELPAFTATLSMASHVAAAISIGAGTTGLTHTYATACASGATAVGEAMLAIRAGRLDVAIAGGVDSMLTPLAVSAFAALRAASTSTRAPEEVCRPFDRDRDGFVFGEGAAFFVLESRQRAEERGATVIGTVAGYGANSDAYHIVAPQPEGSGAAACMSLAIADAGLAPSEIGQINSHGTSTVHNDRAETVAILEAFGPEPPPVTATKGVTGHAFGASGAIEVAASLLSANAGTVPPVANHHHPDDVTQALPIVAGRPVKVGPHAVLSNSFGFGGHNVALVLLPGAS